MYLQILTSKRKTPKPRKKERKSAGRNAIFASSLFQAPCDWLKQATSEQLLVTVHSALARRARL